MWLGAFLTPSLDWILQYSITGLPPTLNLPVSRHLGREVLRVMIRVKLSVLPENATQCPQRTNHLATALPRYKRPEHLNLKLTMAYSNVVCLCSGATVHFSYVDHYCEVFVIYPWSCTRSGGLWKASVCEETVSLFSTTFALKLTSTPVVNVTTIVLYFWELCPFPFICCCFFRFFFYQ